MPTDIPLITLLSIATLLPFLVACGTCYVKFSIVFVMVRNALGLQQIPSNMTLNGIALILAFYVMSPIIKQGYDAYSDNHVNFSSIESIVSFTDNNLDSYRSYLKKYTDPELSRFFSSAETNNNLESNDKSVDSIFALLPAYALTEIKNAFKIGFYIYLPFVVIDLLISSILLSLGMMMMSPVTISVPIKLVLFVIVDGWSLLSKGLVSQYLDIMPG